MKTWHAVDVISDHTTPLAALIWLNRADAEPRIDGDDGTFISWWIAPGPEADAGLTAANYVRDHAPGCTHADWWPPQRTEVTP